jgi:tetratricopeptide (TPR) repeat protein
MKLPDRFRRSRQSSAEAIALGEASVRRGQSDRSSERDAQSATQWCREGDELAAKGEPAKALDAYQRAIDLVDGCAEGHFGQARAYLALGHAQDAADCLEIALAFEPMHVDALCLLALVRRDAANPHSALDLLERAAVAAPDRADIALELGLAQNRCGRTEAAMATYRAAMVRFPADPAPRVNLGLIHLQQLGEPRAAERLFREALSLGGRAIEPLANLGLALQDQGRYEEALALYDDGITEYPECNELRWNRALAMLALGRYAKGWPDYELRLQRAGGRQLQRFAFPAWDGRPLTRERLLVLAEQGLGDEIMFASVIPDLAAIAPHVVLECSPRLATLFARSFPQVSVHGLERHDTLQWLDAYPDIAAKIPIGSLPGFFRASADAFPAHCGYLAAAAPRVHHYRERLRALGGTLTVGISWRGGTRATRGELRSFGLDELQPLLAVASARFVCLQHGITQSERELLRALGVMVWEEALSDLDEHAALVSALDLVVTAANTNAHLAGALGRRCWVLLNQSPDWRWLRAGERSTWYPSLRLFRCRGAERWGPVVGEVTKSLRQLNVAPVMDAMDRGGSSEFQP